MLSLIPWYCRWLAIAALGAALFGYGYLRGHEAGKAAGEADLARFQASVAAEGAKAAAHTQQVIANQEAINVKISTDYQHQLAALRARVQQPTRADGSQIPVISETACRTDAGTANPVPAQTVELVPKADYDQLRSDAAVTTLMLVKLQQWATEQQAAFP